MRVPARPMTAPLATITERMSPSVAPRDAIIPNERMRRWAITAKPATDTRPTKTSPMVTSSRVTVEPESRPAGGGRKFTMEFDGKSNDVSADGLPSKRTVVLVARAIWPGATRANSSVRLSGSSTIPTTVRAADPPPGAVHESPMCRLYRLANWRVTATCPAPVGNRPDTTFSME